MSPESKMLLDEMHRLFTEQSTKIDTRLTESDHRIDELFAESERKLDSRFTDGDRRLEKRFVEVEDSINKRFIDINESLTKRIADSDLNLERRIITDSELRQSTLISDSEQRQDLRLITVEHAAGALERWRQESEGAVDDLNGHHVELTTRVDGIGDTTSQFHCSANGMSTIPNTVVPPTQSVVHDGQLLEHESDTTHPNTGRLPKFDFPAFEGDNPKLWIVQAEDYFDMYHIPKPIWVRVSRMRFRGGAGRTEEVTDSICKPEGPKPIFRGNIRNAAPQHRVPAAEKPGDDKVAMPTSEDKLSTLRSYRRARGLCERCAEKWVRGHKCAATVQLHAIQEIWDMFSIDEPVEMAVDATEQLLLALSHDARMGSQTHRTISFNGSIQGMHIVVLVDSGSSVSFLSASVADALPQLPRVPMSAYVKVANGQLLRCNSAILGCEFSLGEYAFQHAGNGLVGTLQPDADTLESKMAVSTL
ncbi:unnamed protein product [Miscanthus lutarioriparius]|uniref:Uncharacterized protein n=1 Tax=Miscanthus lutarioriparius TaxID=422564 RepID=A0A811R9Y1_9POAL|nr:unnamed protein product [Miscanthus lutarioriparius]